RRRHAAAAYDPPRAHRRPRGPRAGAARLPRPVPLRRRHGAPARGHAVRRREGAPRPGLARVATPQPAAARRADEPPRPHHPRGLPPREALSWALNEFGGPLIVGSRDRALRGEVGDEFWLVAHGKVLPFDGALDDYQKWLLDPSRATARGAPPPPLPGGTAG